MNDVISHPWFHSSPVVRRFILWLAITAIFLTTDPASVFAQRATTKAAANNRFLFIVDTSSGMNRHRDEVLKSVSEIIGNSASGQMHYGDTLGLWTFNDDIFSEFPLQTWATAERENINQQVITFLKSQRLGKGSRFDKVLPNLLDIVANSDILTIFIYSNSGLLKMAGSPFDQEFNSVYQTDLAESKKQHLPVVIVLQAKGGKLFRYTINPMPWPVVIPELPIPIKSPDAIGNNIASTSISAPPVAVITNAPLIMSGNKVNEANVLAANPAVVPDALSSNAPPRLFPKNSPPPPSANLPSPPPPSFKPPVLPVTSVPTLTPLQTVAITPTTPPTATLPSPTVAAAPVVLPTPPAFSPPTVPLPNPLAPTSQPTNAPEVMTPAAPASPFTRISNANTMRRPLPMAPVNPAPSFAVVTNAPATNAITGAEALSRLKTTIKEQTNVAAKIVVTNSTNAVVATKSWSERALAFIAPPGQNRSQSLLILAAILVLIAILLIVVIVRRSRTTGPSLISRSLKK